MPDAADRPTFSQRLRSMEQATSGATLDRPCLTAIIFFLTMGLLGAPAERSS